MATDVRNPTSDENVVGAWTGTVGSRYTLVDDYPDTVPTDVLDSPTATGGAQITFGFSAFSIPAGSTGISVQVLYYDRDVTSGNNNAGARLKVGGTYYNSATHNPTTTLTQHTENWATNPKSTAAWTVDDINGVGANALQAFGFNSTDASPALRFSCVEIQVTYDPPINGSLAQTQANQTIAATGTADIQGSLSKAQVADTLTADGTVTSAAISGSLDQVQAPQTIDSAGKLDVQGSLSDNQDAQTGAGSGKVDIAGVLSYSQPSQTETAQGTVEIQSTLSITQAANTLSATGTVSDQGAITGSLDQMQAANGISAQGAVAISGSASKSQAADQIAASGQVSIAGQAAVAQADETIAANGTVVTGERTGTLAVTQADQGVSSAGTVLIVGSATLTQVSQYVEGSGGSYSPISGSLAAYQYCDFLESEAVIGPIFVPSPAPDDETPLPPGHARLEGSYSEWELHQIKKWVPGD